MISIIVCFHHPGKPQLHPWHLSESKILSQRVGIRFDSASELNVYSNYGIADKDAWLQYSVGGSISGLPLKNLQILPFITTTQNETATQEYHRGGTPKSSRR